MTAPPIARSAAQRAALYTLWEAPIPAGAVLLCQPDEQVVVLAEGQVRNVLSEGRFELDPARLPFLADRVDPASGTLRVRLCFVTVHRPVTLAWEGPVGDVEEHRPKARVSPLLRVRLSLAVEEVLALAELVGALGDKASPEALVAEWTRRLEAWVKHWAQAVLSREGVVVHLGVAAGARLQSRLREALGEATPAMGLALQAVESLEVLLSQEAAGRLRALGAVVPEEAVRVEPAPEAATGGARTSLPFAHVGSLRTRCQTPDGDASALLHDVGVPMVVADAGVAPWWRGSQPTVWAVRQATRPSLGVSPQGIGLYATEAEAQAAYARARQALGQAVPGLQTRDARGDAPRLAPGSVRAEAFLLGGEEVAWLSVDQLSDALALAAMTPEAHAFTLGTGEALGIRAGGRSLHLALRRGEGGVEGVVLGDLGDASPETMERLVEGSWEPVPTGEVGVDLPSGVALVFWGAVSGSALAGGVDAEDGVKGILRGLTGRDAGALATAFDLFAGGALAYAVRVRPGRYRVEVFRTAEPAGRCVVLTHSEATAWRPGSAVQKPVAGPAAEDDPEVLPGTSHPRVSDFGRLLQRLKRGERAVVLAQEGLDDASADAVQLKWLGALGANPSLVPRLAPWMR